MNPEPIALKRRLLSAKPCIAEIFGDSAEAPSFRWWQGQMRRGIIPFYRIGRLVWFDPDEVREALARKCHVGPKFSPTPRIGG